MLAILADQGDVDRCRAILLRTSELLDANWASVRRLAQALYEAKMLGPAELEDHFARFPALCPYVEEGTNDADRRSSCRGSPVTT